MRRKFYSLKASVCFVAFILGISSVKAQTVNIYASTTGSATGAGTSAGAPVTISRARAIAKANPTHPCTIWLASGIYYRLTLDATDSRSASAPVTYQSMVKGGAIFQPTMTLPTSSFSAIPASIQSRIIDPTAKTHVKQISLTSFNLPDMNAWGRSFSQVNMHIPEFFYNGAALPMSRWPADTSWMKMGDIISKGSAGSSPGGIFKYRDGRARYWVNAISDGGVYLCGNWQVPWTMDVILTKAINTTDSTITQDIDISGGIGSQSWREPRGQEEYCAINLVEEIRAEGQWAINTKTKMLYMWVPASGNVQMSGDWTMAAITATGVNYTNFVGLAVRGGSGNGINLTGCNNVLIAGADISYVGRNAVAITDGRNCTVQSSDLHNLGAGGVIIKSSNFLLDQAKVNKSNHQVINNHIYTYAQQVPLYSAAVNVYDAVGTYVAYNKVHDCPHVGIMYGGNSNRLEYNEVYDVVKRYSDMGCFYTWSDVNVWNRRGNVINHNLVHDAPLAHGLYGDNYASGDSNTYNIVTGVSMALFDHYGYFNSYTNNIVYNSTYPVTTMTEATSNSSYSTHYSSLQSLWTANAAYQGAYPECNDMVGTSGRNNAYTSKIWPLVQGNVFFNNPGVMSNVNDHYLFNADGTTNASYAQTGPPFVTWGTVFKENVKLLSGVPTAGAAYSMDALRSTAAFARTKGTDWHINRIGLHADQYRTNISGVKTLGIDPRITLHVITTNNYTNPQVLTLWAGVKAPNAANLFSSVKFFQYNTEMKNMVISRQVISYDSVIYTLKLTNPAPDPSVPDFHITFRCYDGQYWQYISNMVVYTIKTATAPTTSLAVVASPGTTASGTTATMQSASVANQPASTIQSQSVSTAQSASAGQPSTVQTAAGLQWTTENEQGVASYQVMESLDGVNYQPIATVNAKCNDSSKCTYFLPATPDPTRVTHYKVTVTTQDSATSETNTVKLGEDIASRISLFPNPARDFINFTYNSPDDAGDANLLIYDIQGKVLQKRPFTIHAGPNTLYINLAGMPKGIYMAGLQFGLNTAVVKRFVIQN